MLNILRYLIIVHLCLLVVTIENPNYKLDNIQQGQIETLHDPQDTFRDGNQIDNEFLEPIRQNLNTLSLDNTSSVLDENDTVLYENKTYTHIFTVTTDSKTFNIPTRQIEHNTNDNETNSMQNDSSILSTRNTTTIQSQTFSQVTRSYDPPPLPPQLPKHTTHNSQQQGSSNMHTVQYVTQTQSQQTTNLPHYLWLQYQI